MESKADWPCSCEHGSQGPKDTRNEFEGATRPPRDDAGGFGGRGADRPQLYQHDRASKICGVDRHDREDRCRSEEHTSELQSLMRISYAVFCLKKKNTQYTNQTN